MNDEQIRITVITEMFLGLGQEPTPERIAYYIRLTKNVPTKYLRVACDSAVCKSTTGFPATPGQIIDEAERIHRDRIVTERARLHAEREAESDAVRRELTEKRDADDAESIGEIIDMSLRKNGAA